jgi:cysteine desulfurase/selenocysteine lyase
MARRQPKRILVQEIDVMKIRHDFPVLSRSVGGKPLVYLDSAATSQKPQVMIDRLVEVYGEQYSRPEEGHSLSMEATRSFEGVRSKVATLINATDAREIVFCRGATEALNLVSRIVEHSGLNPGDEVLLSELEHHSNIIPWLLLCRQTGIKVKAAPIRSNGDLDLERFEEMLTERVRFVSVTHVSNVTGGVQPVKRIVEMAHQRGIQIMVDGAQALAHLPIDVREIGCDYYAASGHKMGGPSSVGFLYGRLECLENAPVADGGSTMDAEVSFDSFKSKPPPHKYEAGEPAYGEVEGWGPAIDYWLALGLENIAEYERALTAYAARRLSDTPGVRVVGDPVDRISVISFVVEGQEPNETARELDREGIAVRAGKLAAQPLLEALGVKNAVRASFMFYNTYAEADFLVEQVRKIADRAY